MSEPFDPLEDELRAIAPQELSPELKERIADWLAPAIVVRPEGKFAKGAIRGLIAIGVAAACTLALIFLWRGSERNITVEASGESLEPLLTNAFDEGLPSVWQYRSALNRSPNEFEALLDRHAGRPFDAEPSRTPIRGFGRFDTNFDTSLGEL
jgi:hypothetical protein